MNILICEIYFFYAIDNALLPWVGGSMFKYSQSVYVDKVFIYA
jgi:hypothetical protein